LHEDKGVFHYVYIKPLVKVVSSIEESADCKEPFLKTTRIGVVLEFHDRPMSPMKGIGRYTKYS
jgi:hypothetical protein